MAPQTNTAATIRNNSEIKTGEQQPSISNRLIGLVNNIGQSSEYVALRSQKFPHTEAFRGAINTIVDSPENGFSNFDTALLKVTSGLGTFIEAQGKLDEISERRSNGESRGREDYKLSQKLKREHAIPFNHNLKSLINEGPNLNMQDLSSALARTHEFVFNRYNNLDPSQAKDAFTIASASEVTLRLETAINGMRHEVATESMLSAAGVDFSYDISVEEDARGVDIIAVIDRPDTDTGKPSPVRVPIDIKSSRTLEQRARIRHPGSVTVWTGLYQDDFTGIKGTTPNALTIPFETAVDHADTFMNRINSIIDNSEQYKAKARKNIGQVATR
jgi:hypothetical protein